MTQERIKVLLIEDDVNEGSRIKGMLAAARNAKFDVYHALHLADAVKHLAAGEFDVILSDLWLPDSSALQTLDHVRKHASQAPVIVLTALDNESMATKALESGASEYLFKSQLDTQLLSSAIHYVLQS